MYSYPLVYLTTKPSMQTPRRLLFTTIGALVWAAAWQTGASGSSSAAIDLTPVRLTDRAWFFRGALDAVSRANRGFMSNAGFVVTDDGVVVFDALGTPALGRAMIEAVREVTEQPIRRVIVSHYHADHMYGLSAFRDIGADIWARGEGRRYLASDGARRRLDQRRDMLGPWMGDQSPLVPADRWLELPRGERMSFRMGGVEFVLISAGFAHARDDLMLLVPDEQLMFAGDIYAAGRIPFVEDGDTRGWLTAMQQMEDAAPTIVVPGHGRVSRDLDEDIRLTRDYIRFLRERMRAAVENFVPFEQAYANTDWSRFADQPAFEAANRGNAYSVYLEMEQAVLE